MRRLNILTWHTHGSYLYYLSQVPHDFHVLAKPGRPPGYGGRCGPFPFGANVHELPAEQARARRFGCILFQEDHHWEKDQYELLTPAQRALPRIYLEHDPPRGAAARAWPTDTRHLVDDPAVLLVHVTPYNALHAELRPHGSRVTAVVAGGMRTLSCWSAFPSSTRTRCRTPPTSPRPSSACCCCRAPAWCRS